MAPKIITFGYCILLSLLFTTFHGRVAAQNSQDAVPLSFFPRFIYTLGSPESPQTAILVGNDEVLKYSYSSNLVENLTVDASFRPDQLVGAASVSPATVRVLPFVSSSATGSLNIIFLYVDSGAVTRYVPQPTPMVHDLMESAFSIEITGDYLIYMTSDYDAFYEIHSINLATMSDSVIGTVSLSSSTFAGGRFHRGDGYLYFGGSQGNAMYRTNGTDFETLIFGPSIDHSTWTLSAPVRVTATKTAWIATNTSDTFNPQDFIHVYVCDRELCESTVYNVSGEGFNYEISSIVGTDECVLVTISALGIPEGTRVIDFADNNWRANYTMTTFFQNTVYSLGSYNIVYDANRPWSSVFLIGWDDGNTRFLQPQRRTGFDLELSASVRTSSSNSLYSPSEFPVSFPPWLRSVSGANSNGVLFYPVMYASSVEVTLLAVSFNETSMSTEIKEAAILQNCAPSSAQGLGVLSSAFSAAANETILLLDSHLGTRFFRYSHFTGAVTLGALTSTMRVLSTGEAVYGSMIVGQVSDTEVLMAIYTSNQRVVYARTQATLQRELIPMELIGLAGSNMSCSAMGFDLFEPLTILNSSLSVFVESGGAAWLVDGASNTFRAFADQQVPVVGKRSIAQGPTLFLPFMRNRGRAAGIFGDKIALLTPQDWEDTSAVENGYIALFNMSNLQLDAVVAPGFHFPLQESSVFSLTSTPQEIDWLFPATLGSYLNYMRFRGFLNGTYSFASVYSRISDHLVPRRASVAYRSPTDGRIYQCLTDLLDVAPQVFKKRAWGFTYSGPVAFNPDNGAVEYLPGSSLDTFVLPFGSILGDYFIFIEKNGTEFDSSTHSLQVAAYNIQLGVTVRVATLCEPSQQNDCSWLNFVPAPQNRKRTLIPGSQTHYVSTPICGQLGNSYSFMTKSNNGSVFQLMSLSNGNLLPRDLNIFADAERSSSEKGIRCFAGPDGLMYVLTTRGIFSTDGITTNVIFQPAQMYPVSLVEKAVALNGTLLLEAESSTTAQRVQSLPCFGGLCLASPQAASPPVAQPAVSPPPTFVPVSSAFVESGTCLGDRPFRRVGLPKAVCINSVWVFLDSVTIDRFRPIEGDKPIVLEFPQTSRIEGNFRIRRRRPVPSPTPTPTPAPIVAPMPVLAPVAPSPVAPVPQAAPVSPPVDASPAAAPQMADVDPTTNPVVVNVLMTNSNHTITGCVEFSGNLVVQVAGIDAASVTTGSSYTLFNYNGGCSNSDSAPDPSSERFEVVTFEKPATTNWPNCVKPELNYELRSMAVVFVPDNGCTVDGTVTAGNLPVGAIIGIIFAIIVVVAVIVIVLIYRFRHKIIPSYRSARGLKNMRSKVSNANSAEMSTRTSTA